MTDASLVPTQVDDENDDIPETPYRLTIGAIEWERVLLTIHLQLATIDDEAPIPAASEVTFELVDGKRTFDAPAVAQGDGAYTIKINITCFAGRKAIANGTWRVRAVTPSGEGPVASFDGGDLERLDEASRVFLYNGNRSVMTVSYGIAETDEGLDFLMRTYQLSRSGPKGKRKNLFKRIQFKLVGTPTKVKWAGRIYTYANRWVGPRPGRIFFASDQRLKIEGNLRRVQERMIERGLDKNMDLKYSFRLPRTTGWGTTIRILYLLATSEVVLLDDYFGLLKSVRIQPGTKVIQLWHAGSGFKSVGYSRFGNPGSPKLWHPHRQYTYAITGSQHLVPVYAEAFGIEESAVIPTGLPRVDWFLDEDRKNSFTAAFYEEFPAFLGKRIILFAPTFRGRSIHTAFYDYDSIDFDALYQACGPDTVVLFRMHHIVKTPIPIPEQYQDRFFDFTHFPDGLNLLHVTDLLITDYSSIIYEFSLLDRPMLFFAPDKINYGATRGFHRDYDETAPGRVAMTFDDVIDAITTGEYEQEKVAKFREENFDRIDTGAADRVIDWLILGDPDTTSAPALGVPAYNEDPDSGAMQESAEQDIDSDDDEGDALT